MEWKNLLARLGARSNPIHKTLDRKLIYQVKSRFIPSWRQFKYINQFLNPKEKKVIISVGIICLLLAFSWLGIFLHQKIAVAPKYGGDYSEAMVGQPKYLNPLFSSTSDIDTDLVSLAYSGLLRYDETQKLVPNLATGYTLSDDKKNYTFTLRPGVAWSDDQPFTADDVIYTFETIQNPEVGSPLFPGFQGVIVEKIDNLTVRFTLKEPFAPFLNSLTVGILPEHIWIDTPPSGMKLAKNNLQPIGTGSWIFEKLLKDETGNIQSYTLKRNEKFYGQKPFIQTLNFQFYPDYDQAITAIRGQKVDAISFAPKKYKDKITGKKYADYRLYLPQYIALFLNNNNQAELKNIELRQALALGIDKQQVIQQALGGEGFAIDAPILSGMLGFNADIKKMNYAPEEAQTLLDKKWPRLQPEEYFKLRSTELMKTYGSEIEAAKANTSTPDIVSTTITRITGQVEQTVREEMSSQQPFYRKNKDGRILSLSITTSDSPEFKKTAEIIAGFWQTLGIQASVVALPVKQLTHESIKDRSYQILLYGEIIGNDPDLYPFWHSSQVNYPGLNLSQYVNRDADKLLETARLTTDPAEREKLYKNFQDTLVKDLPAVFLYQPSHNFIVNTRIHGLKDQYIFSPSDRYAALNNWYIKTRWIWK